MSKKKRIFGKRYQDHFFMHDITVPPNTKKIARINPAIGILYVALVFLLYLMWL